MSVEKGNGFMAEAKKALCASGFSAFFSSKTDKYEKAVESFEKAGNAYKICKAWQLAAEAYTEAAICYIQIGQQSDAASKHKEAGDCYKNVDARLAVSSFKSAVGIYVDSGRWNTCGNLTKTIAEMFETEEAFGAEDAKLEALETYQQAADYYNMESPPRTQAAQQCLEKVAELSTGRGDFGRAASIFEDIAKNCLGSKLLKFNARGHMLKSLLCSLAAGDNVKTGQKLAEYAGLDLTLEGSREEKFISALLAAVNTEKSDAFGAACADFNSVKKIDPWMTSLLLVIKRQIPVEAEAEPETAAAGAAADSDEDLT
jgi:alpha-soluble NSF attachment protein